MNKLLDGIFFDTPFDVHILAEKELLTSDEIERISALAEHRERNAR